MYRVRSRRHETQLSVPVSEVPSKDGVGRGQSINNINAALIWITQTGDSGSTTMGWLLLPAKARARGGRRRNDKASPVAHQGRQTHPTTREKAAKPSDHSRDHHQTLEGFLTLHRKAG